MKKQAFFILLLLISQLALAQYQNMNWFFGNGTRLNFSTAPPTASHIGQITNNNNSVTYSNPLTGQLEFYTNGHYIYNYNHNMIQGSQDDFVGDDIVSVLICPYPNHYEKYFVFTTVRHHHQTKFYYSVVDMMGNNGLGTVNVLNEPMPGLPADAGSDYFGSNQVIAKHADGQSFWLLTAAYNQGFRIYATLINANGIATIPVNNILNVDTPLRIGILAIDPDNHHLFYIAKDSTPSIDHEGLLSIINMTYFNNTTGQIDSNITRFNDIYNSGGYFSDITSVEFGEDMATGNLILYILCINQGNYSGDEYMSLAQCSVVPSPSSTEYVNLNTNYFITGNRNYSDDFYVNLPRIRKGMDGKLYFMNLDYGNQGLSVINNPNVVGAGCDYSQNVVDLQGFNLYNLPVNVESYSSCVENWVEYNDYTSGYYVVIRARNNITAYNTIENGAKGEYRAGNSIDLKPGFSALAGSDFLAIIDACNVVLNKPNENDLHLENTWINNDDELKTVVYPNPVKDVLTIKSKNQILGVKLTNKSGEIFFESNQISKKQVELNITPYQKGLYFLKITLRDKTLIKKIIIE